MPQKTAFIAHVSTDPQEGYIVKAVFLDKEKAITFCDRYNREHPRKAGEFACDYDEVPLEPEG